jgi:hypothetical protein
MGGERILSGEIALIRLSATDARPVSRFKPVVTVTERRGAPRVLHTDYPCWKLEIPPPRGSDSVPCREISSCATAEKRICGVASFAWGRSSSSHWVSVLHDPCFIQHALQSSSGNQCYREKSTFSILHLYALAASACPHTLP